jgi:hypothetical protein
MNLFEKLMDAAAANGYYSIGHVKSEGKIIVNGHTFSNDQEGVQDAITFVTELPQSEDDREWCTECNGWGLKHSHE